MTEPRRWRVAFAGTPPFAAEALRALLAAGHEVPLVLTQPDRPAGRGQHLQASAVKQLAQAHGLPVAQPQGLRLDGRHAADAAHARDALLAARPDVIVVAAYGLLLPPWALELAPGGCLNIHASRLPRWRGAAPVHRAIEAGDAVTGITLMQMDEGLDTGAMVAMVDEPIAADDTTGRLMQRLASRGGELLVHTLARAAAWPLPSTPQPAEGASYARKIDKTESAIDWRGDAAALARQVRALDPAPGATAQIAGLVFKVWRAEAVARPPEAQDARAGQVIAAGPTGVQVACGIGALHLLELQRPGGRRGPAGQALRAGEVRLGDDLLLDAAA